jgi:hypothetical protein
MLEIIFGNDYESISKYLAKEPVASYERVLTLNSIVNYLYQKTLLDEPESLVRGYVIKYDLDFLKASETDWGNIKEVSKDKDLVFVYQDLDKRSKFYNFFKDCCTEYNNKVSNEIFSFVDLVVIRNKKVFDFVQNIQADDVIGALSLLYSKFRCILQIQSTPKEIDISENTGLLKNTIFYNKKYCGFYSDSEIVNILRWIDTILVYIKTGVLDSNNALDYLLLNII